MSRHFSEVVPGIMTRVRLPPDPSTTFMVGKENEKRGAGCITTIVDTQGDESLLVPSKDSKISENSLSASQTRGGSSGICVENFDSIVLVYDLTRSETFHRLENHWLPLIEECYNGEENTKAKVSYKRRNSSF